MNGASDSLLSRGNRKLSFAIYTTIALVAFEGTSVAAALPELAADLGEVGRLPWVITAFLFALGVSTIVAGPLVDALGSRRLFLWSAAGFAGTGFAAGLANDLDVLIAIRLVQGATSGVLFAAVIAAVNLGFPEHMIARAFAANSTIWGLMGAASPAIAAALLSVASWRWIFFINLPLGVCALVAGRDVMPQRQPDAEPPSVDLRGTVLAAVFTLASIAAVDRLGPESIVFAALAIGAVLVYVRHARRVARPVVSLEHLAVQPHFGLAVVPSLMLTAAFGVNVYITVYVAAGRGVANGTAAWSVIFFTVGWTLGANIASRIAARWAPAQIMAGGLGVSTAGLVVVSVAAAADASLIAVFTGLTLVGVGIGLTTNASLTLLRAATPLGQIGRASAANQFARSQGFTLGAAGGGSILLFVVGRRLGSVDPVRRLLAGEESVVDADTGAVSSAAVAEAVRGGFTVVSVVALAVIVVAVPLMVRLYRQAMSSSLGAEVTQP